MAEDLTWCYREPDGGHTAALKSSKDLASKVGDRGKEGGEFMHARDANFHQEGATMPRRYVSYDARAAII